MLIVLEQPGKRKSTRDRELERSKILSYCATVSHRRKIRTLNPHARPWSSRAPRESRSLTFYKTRTSLEWSGFGDQSFWTSFVPSLAYNHASISHMIIAIAAFHEAMESNDQRMKSFSVSQANQAMKLVNEEHVNVPMAIVRVQCILSTILSALLSDRAWEQAARAQNILINREDEDQHGIILLMKRNQSRHCQFISPLYLLRRAPVAPSEPFVPDFRDLRHAREVLEQVLNKAAREKKSGQLLDRRNLDEWETRFNNLRPKVDYPTWLGLKAAYGISWIQIDTMYSDNEMVYDQYMDVYKDVADALKLSLEKRRSPSGRFGLDDGLCGMLGWVIGWCRDPPLRLHLIQLMRTSIVIEEVASLRMSADRRDALRKVEEDGIDPPPTCCSDIPESQRVRFYSFAHYGKWRAQRLDFLRSPYTGPVQSIWLSTPLEDLQFELEAFDPVIDTESDFVYGPDYRSSRQTDGSCYTVRAEEFYFMLPKL